MSPCGGALTHARESSVQQLAAARSCWGVAGAGSGNTGILANGLN